MFLINFCFLECRILIIDWDIHHGNGTQRMFQEDKRVLYVSLHRKDIFPYAAEKGPIHGDSCFVGIGKGAGFTVNIAWPKVSCNLKSLTQ